MISTPDDPDARTATEHASRAALDDAVRAHLAAALEPGEIIVNWLVVAGTRRVDGGGAVITSPHQEAVPKWEAEGILRRALKNIDAEDDDL